MKTTYTIKNVKTDDKSNINQSNLLTKTNDKSNINQSNLLNKTDDKSNINQSNELITYNSTVKNLEGKILFNNIKQSKEEIKKHRLIIANSYAKLIPLITISINAKKLLYPN